MDFANTFADWRLAILFGVLAAAGVLILAYLLKKLLSKSEAAEKQAVIGEPKSELRISPTAKPLDETLTPSRPTIEREPVLVEVDREPKIAPPPRPHTVEEIQLHEPKKLADALSNTRTSFFGRLKQVFARKDAKADDALEGIEEVLYTSDLGPQTVQRLMGAVQGKLGNGTSDFEAFRVALKNEMIEILGSVSGDKGNGKPLTEDEVEWEKDRAIVRSAGERYSEGLEHLNIWNHKPAVLMVVGVNGAGKTTTIGKLSRRIAQSGRKVLVAAGDTFRAAAGDQLKVWTERAQVEIFSPEGVSDPSAVAFDAVQSAHSRGFDVVIIDTAGRLHTQKNLMEELKKMKRVIAKVIETAPHEILLVLDANNGQNALVQAREFNGALDVSGVVLTKLDGTAKGGVAVGLACELGLPIKLIGVGEGIEDLRRFSPTEFVDSII